MSSLPKVLPVEAPKLKAELVAGLPNIPVLVAVVCPNSPPVVAVVPNGAVLAPNSPPACNNIPNSHGFHINLRQIYTVILSN